MTVRAGGSTDIWLYNETCSVTITVSQGQKFVLLTQEWRYATALQAPMARDVGESTDFTVTVTGVTQLYSSTQHGAIDAPPPSSWTLDEVWDNGDSFWYLDVINVLDVSQLTKSGSITLTLRLDTQVPAPWPGYLEYSPLSVQLGLYGGIGLKLTQTPAGSTSPPTSPPATWAPAVPQSSASPNPRSGLKLTQTSASFRPRDARDPAADCGNHDGDCHPQFTATLTGLETLNDWDLRPTVSVTLVPATVPTPSAGPWLAGTSTNYGTDSATDPDYLFETNAQPNADTSQNLIVPVVISPSKMETAAGAIPVGYTGVAPPNDARRITFKVTSHDFGGKAYLRAALTLDPSLPTVYYADIVDDSGQKRGRAKWQLRNRFRGPSLRQPAGGSGLQRHRGFVGGAVP